MNVCIYSLDIDFILSKNFISFFFLNCTLFVADQSERGQTDEQFPFSILILSGLRINSKK